MIDDNLLADVDEILPSAIQIRRHLHENPELTAQEFQTSAYLKRVSCELGLKITPVPRDDISAGTGFIATMDTGHPGLTVGLRTDMDALPIQENPVNLVRGRATISQRDGVMHACGHDGHMAILISTMKLLSARRNQLRGRIIFIFEEGEEASTGIHAMVEFLKTKKLDAIFGQHLFAGLKTGAIAISEGPMTSSSLRLRMTVHGKSGHISRPDLAINPVVAAAYIVTNLAGAWVNQLPADEMMTFGISQITGSPVRNVIPDHAFIGGSLRYFSDAIGDRALEIIRHVAEQVARAHGCTVSFSDDSGPSARAVINRDQELLAIGRQAINELFPDALVSDCCWNASETFGHYAVLCPTLFSLVGTRNITAGSGAEHHNERFDLDERSLRFAIATMTRATTLFLRSDRFRKKGGGLNDGYRRALLS